jgi:hypothetical protein
MTWFIRQHRGELIEYGALLMFAGRWLVEPASFDSYLLESARRAALDWHK